MKDNQSNKDDKNTWDGLSLGSDGRDLLSLDGSTGHEVDKMFWFAGLLTGNKLKSMELIMQIILILLGYATVCLEMIWRKDFGHRYLNVMRIFMAVSFLQVYSLVADLLAPLYRFRNILYLRGISYVLIVVIVLLGVWHRAVIWRRNRKRKLVYSMSNGVSHLSALSHYGVPFVHNDWICMMYIEPALTIFLGLVLRNLNPPLGFLMILSGVAYFIQAQMLNARMRSRVDDYVDSQLFAQYLNKAVNQYPKSDSAGISVPPEMTHILETLEMQRKQATAQDTMSAEDKQAMRRRNVRRAQGMSDDANGRKEEAS